MLDLNKVRKIRKGLAGMVTLPYGLQLFWGGYKDSTGRVYKSIEEYELMNPAAKFALLNNISGINPQITAGAGLSIGQPGATNTLATINTSLPVKDISTTAQTPTQSVNMGAANLAAVEAMPQVLQAATEMTANGLGNKGSGLSAGQIGSAIGLGADFIGGFIDKSNAYNGLHGGLKLFGDQAFDAASNAVMSINPLVGGIMKAGGLVSDVLTNYAGMGTDNMTKGDAILGSKLLSLTPEGMINGFFGKKTLKFSADQNTIAQVGSSYGGTVAGIGEAVSKANKKYGLFSSGSRRRANRYINKMRGQLNIMTDIADEAADQLAMAGNLLNYLNYQYLLNGGLDLRYLRAARIGMKLAKRPIPVEELLKEWEPIIPDITIFKLGGTIEWEPVIEFEWEPIIPDITIFKLGGKTRTIEELIEYAKQLNPRFIQRLSEEPKGIKFKDDEGNDAEGSHYLESRGEYVIPRILEIDGELKFFNPQEAIDKALENGNFLKMSIDEAKLFAKYYKQGWPKFFKEFKSGGKLDKDAPKIETDLKNVIPEGALHARKHHMDEHLEITLKGIPVIDNNGEQQAEIEVNEIIFNLEVTKKLEELCKDGSDEAAIEAGKLLVEQILFNTDDRTGLIDKCKEGGKLEIK